MTPSRFLSCAILAGLLLVSTGCGAAAEPPASPSLAELGVPFTLPVGAAARLDDDRVIVSFAEVPDDSRCPAGTTCVWEGDATVVAEVTVEGHRSRPELHTSPRFTTEVVVDGYRIALVALRPSPPGETVPVGDYRADLLVTEA
ncbi:hypothetical protein ACWCPQ_11330 [Nocardia sp. NPDC001965]